MWPEGKTPTNEPMINNQSLLTFSWRCMTTRLFFRPSSNFLDFSFSFFLYHLDLISVLPTSNRPRMQTIMKVCTEIWPKSDTWYTHTCTKHMAQHTCRHVKVSVWFVQSGGVRAAFALLQNEGLVHLPSVFYSGCQNGEEEAEQDMWFTAKEDEI